MDSDVHWFTETGRNEVVCPGGTEKPGLEEPHQ